MHVHKSWRAPRTAARVNRTLTTAVLRFRLPGTDRAFSAVWPRREHTWPIVGACKKRLRKGDHDAAFNRTPRALRTLSRPGFDRAADRPRASRPHDPGRSQPRARSARAVRPPGHAPDAADGSRPG